MCEINCTHRDSISLQPDSSNKLIPSYLSCSHTGAFRGLYTQLKNTDGRLQHPGRKCLDSLITRVQPLFTERSLIPQSWPNFPRISLSLLTLFLFAQVGLLFPLLPYLKIPTATVKHLCQHLSLLLSPFQIQRFWTNMKLLPLKVQLIALLICLCMRTKPWLHSAEMTPWESSAPCTPPWVTLLLWKVHYFPMNSPAVFWK